MVRCTARLDDNPLDLLDVVGVGEVTLRRYGKAFLDLLREIKADGDG